MTKQEALAELKGHVRCASWINEDYVYRVSKQVLKIAIGALEREVSTYLGLEKMVENVTRSGKTKEIRALLQEEEEVKQMIKKHYSLLESIDERLIEEVKQMIKKHYSLLESIDERLIEERKKIRRSRDGTRWRFSKRNDD